MPPPKKATTPELLRQQVDGCVERIRQAREIIDQLGVSSHYNREGAPLGRARIHQQPPIAPSDSLGRASLMARLEELTPGARIRGVLPEQPVMVVAAAWHGTNAITRGVLLGHREGLWVPLPP